MGKKIILIILPVIVVAAGAYFYLSGGSSGPESIDSGNVIIHHDIDTVVDSEEFRQMPEAEKGETIKQYLVKAAEDGQTDDLGNTIVEDSITVDEDNGNCIYTDSAGGVNVISYGMDQSYTEGEYVDTEESPEWDDSETASTNGILLFGLDSPDSKLAADTKKIADDLNSKGSDCETDMDVTVEDYKTALSGRDYVIIETHGYVLNYGYGFKNASSTKVPVLCTREKITSDRNRAYADDISEQRVAKVTVIDKNAKGGKSDYYWIMPSFFENYYSGGGLDGTYVHMGNCCGFGCSWNGNGTEDDTLAEAFTDCGALAVTGYFNSVFTYYDNALMSVMLPMMVDGAYLSDAYDTALELKGYDDREFAENSGWLDQSSPYREATQKKLDQGVAHMVIYGQSDMRLGDYGQMPEPEEEEEEIPDVSGVWLNEENGAEPNTIYSDQFTLEPDGTGVRTMAGGAERVEYIVEPNGDVHFIFIDRMEGIDKYGYFNDDWTVLYFVETDNDHTYEYVRQ